LAQASQPASPVHSFFARENELHDGSSLERQRELLYGKQQPLMQNIQPIRGRLTPTLRPALERQARFEVSPEGLKQA
jgi:hypothetical protein